MDIPSFNEFVEQYIDRNTRAQLSEEARQTYIRNTNEIIEREIDRLSNEAHRPPRMFWRIWHPQGVPWRTTIELEVTSRSLDGDVVVNALRAEIGDFGHSRRDMSQTVIDAIERLLFDATSRGYLVPDVARQEYFRIREQILGNYAQVRWGDIPTDFDRPHPRTLLVTKEQAEAEKKAKALLRSCLTTEQLIDFDKRGYFKVKTNRGHIYQIEHGKVFNVKRLDPNGRKIGVYCGGPTGSVPTSDFVLAQKLLLETDEDAFLAMANRS